MIRILGALAAALVAAGCTHGLDALASDPAAALVTSGGPSQSMVYARRTSAGIVVVDAGWVGAREQVRPLLSRLDATPGDVVAVLLTHSHRDHIGAWRALRGARFFVGDPEIELLHGRSEHGGWLPRLGDRLLAPDLPEPGEIRVRTFASDTTLVFGADTIRAFLMPGHTAGSAAYLVDGVLFLGDGLSHSTLYDGFRPPLRRYSENDELADRNLRDILRRARSFGVATVCTAHANCASSEDVVRDLDRRPAKDPAAERS
ncbi:MAG TPA: MBL fold metallo-hydrolase [Longimicrobiales bacterium]|nr:MBL fold metallo-hydrolase [Longimicrobiales bacterium]